MNRLSASSKFHRCIQECNFHISHIPAPAMLKSNAQSGSKRNSSGAFLQTTILLGQDLDFESFHRPPVELSFDHDGLL
jgi:hypothetical protein